MTKQIQLTQGKFTLVDDADYEWLVQWKWRYDGKGYAIRGAVIPGTGKQKAVRMHQVIMSTPDGMEVDHQDCDGLNNQRKNLRVCTHAQNLYNRKKTSNNKSGYKGVCWHEEGKKWMAVARKDKQTIYLGLFKDPEDAARAYDAKARELFGEFARTNFDENLRVCTDRQNNHSRDKYVNNTSGFKGVWLDRNKYRASIKVDGKTIHLGTFPTPEDAARAYDAKARELFGEFARTNF